MRFSTLLIAALLLFSGLAQAVPFALPDQFKTVGQTSFKVLWIDIYDARLESPEGLFIATDMPLMLTLDYQRDIKAKKLVKETVKQWLRQGIPDKQYSIWQRKIEAIWPDIYTGDSLTFYQDEQGQGHFYLNFQFIGTVPDPAFSRAFLDIWLAENSAYPGHARALKGVNANRTK